MTDAPRRLASLDAFRGAAVLGMMLAVSQGGDKVYPWLAHAPWHGPTPGDFIFPAFIFIMGVSLAISLGRRWDRGEPAKALLAQVVWRFAAILFLGLLGSAVLAWGESAPMRWPGVLQRIALCYLAGAALFLTTPPLVQGLAAAGILLGYWALLSLVPVPGHGAGVLTPEGSLPSWLDRSLLPGRLLHGSHDPDGLLGTLPACANAVFGALCGQWLRSGRTHGRKAAGMLALAVFGAAGGLLWARVLPLNKPLWTSSFACVTTAAALAGLAACYWLIEVRGLRAWAAPLEVLGRNPLLSYIAAGLLFGLGEFTGAKTLAYARFARVLPPQAASLAVALGVTAACWGAMAWLYRRGIFVKI